MTVPNEHNRKAPSLMYLRDSGNLIDINDLQFQKAYSPIEIRVLGNVIASNVAQLRKEWLPMAITVKSLLPSLTIEGIQIVPVTLLPGLETPTPDFPALVWQVLASSSRTVYQMPSYLKSRARRGGVRVRAVRRRVSRRFIIMLMCVECEFCLGASSSAIGGNEKAQGRTCCPFHTWRLWNCPVK